jgi:hypothetical protein
MIGMEGSGFGLRQSVRVMPSLRKPSLITPGVIAGWFDSLAQGRSQSGRPKGLK